METKEIIMLVDMVTIFGLAIWVAFSVGGKND